MVYVDVLRTRILRPYMGPRVRACRLFADRPEEAQALAKELGITPARMVHVPGQLPHFILVESVRERAIAAGARVADADLVADFEARAKAGEWGGAEAEDAA